MRVIQSMKPTEEPLSPRNFERVNSTRPLGMNLKLDFPMFDGIMLCLGEEML